MKITISGNGVDPDDDLVQYLFVAENETFKGTTLFYQYANAFNDFPAMLEKFPFESKETIAFEADGINISISLADSAGRISFRVSLTDNDGNKVDFVDQTVEVTALHRLASKLRATDFRSRHMLEWSSEES
ncbi:hypothetical protein EYC58_02510 [Candidatus Saccharibacteria bacterium]|nr:MAG: hypothetical protein EYC58_02510 [Candidatus Saccharibacteria bacterium]